MKKITDKLKSRKLWACVLGVAVGIAAMAGIDEGAVSTVSGAVMSLLSVMTYIITEGKIDAAAVASAAQKTEETVRAVQEEK